MEKAKEKKAVNIPKNPAKGAMSATLGDAKDATWDVIVIGGGPSGMMAAGRAAERGAKVLLIEKNSTLGKKLLITGGGRCNVTNAEFDTRRLLDKFKDNGKFLFSAFSQWDVENTLDFFHVKKMETKTENEKRVFPVSDRAQSVWDVLVAYMKEGGVNVMSDSPVTKIVTQGKMITGVQLKDKSIIRGRTYIIATGGTSRPETGSTGDGFKWLKDLGHTVIEPEPSLVPIATKDAWVKRAAGVSLADAKITTFQNNAKQDSRRGKILFTHVGLSGPAILNMSKDIGELLKYGDVTVQIDLLPSLDYGQLNAKLQEIFKENNNRQFKNSLSTLIPPALAPIIVELSKIRPDTQCNGVTRDERINLVQILKHLSVEVKELLGEEKAIVSSGGVSLEEVDFKTMRSKLHSNLYLTGDILNIDRPSGGYSLQLCWTTGFVAGSNAF